MVGCGLSWRWGKKSCRIRSGLEIRFSHWQSLIPHSPRPVSALFSAVSSAAVGSFLIPCKHLEFPIKGHSGTSWWQGTGPITWSLPARSLESQLIGYLPLPFTPRALLFGTDQAFFLDQTSKNQKPLTSSVGVKEA